MDDVSRKQATAPSRRAEELLSVGEVAARSGVAVSALHFYERKGLITSRRDGRNQRRYPRSVLRRIAVVRIAVRLGIPLSTVAHALARLPGEGTASAGDWRELSADWRVELNARIEQLLRLRDDLDGCIGCGCLSLGRCSLINPDDSLGAQGPGARTLDVTLDHSEHGRL